MSATSSELSEWIADTFWDRLHRLELQHQGMQRAHEAARSRLDLLTSKSLDQELYETWTRYCEVIVELEKTTEEFESLRLPYS